MHCASRRYLRHFSQLFPSLTSACKIQLRAREFSRLMTLNGDTVDAVNDHFLKVSSTRKVFSYMKTLASDDEFRAVILATLKASGNPALRAAYNKIIDDLDDAETLTCASIQTVCSRQLRRRHRVRADSPRDRADTPRATPLSSPAKPDKYKKYKTQGAPDTSPSYVTPSPTTVFGPRTLTKRPASTSWTILPFSTPSSPRPSLPSRHLARLPVTPMMRGNVQGFV